MTILSTRGPVRLAAILLTIAAFAATAKPNLSGEWKLNTSKSEFGQMPPLHSMTQKMTHEEPSLKIAVKQAGQRGEFEWEANYATDGKETTNNFGPNVAKTVGKWDGDVLQFETKGKFGDNEFTMKDKWTVSEDGKQLIVNRHFSSSFGEGDQKLIFEKQ